MYRENNFGKGWVNKNMKKLTEKQIEKIRQKAIEMVSEMPKEKKLYTNSNFETKYYSDDFLVNDYVNRYLFAREKNQLSYLEGYMKSKSKTIEGKFHLAQYYDIKSALSKKVTSEESFLDRYGNAKYKKKKIKEYLEEFKKGKITYTEFLEIIDKYKHQAKSKYMKTGSS